MRALVVVAMTCGCEALFHVDQVAIVDGPGSASFAPCAGRQPVPMFCADFDESPTVAYTNGTAVSVVPMGTNVMVEARPPAAHGANALWVTSHGGSYMFQFRDMSRTTTKLTADFAMQIATTAATGTASMFVLRLDYGMSCYTPIQIDEDNQLLQMQSYCPGSNPNKTIQQPLPAASTFVHVHFTFDIAASLATAQIDNGGTVDMAIGLAPAAAVVPQIDFGIEDTGQAGLSIGFDDIVIEASP